MLNEIGYDADADTIGEWLSSDSADPGAQFSLTVRFVILLVNLEVTIQ